MDNTLRLTIVTPEATVCSEDVDKVTLRGVAGELGVLPEHVPLISLAQLRVKRRRHS